ncbi:aspartate/glutamate racemase family protein [candidate division KSB1 bacterium]
MKTIGLLGGMSWESSSVYYQIINREVQKKLGGVHSAKCVMYSVDFGEIEELQHAGEWDKLTQVMVDCAKSIQNAGADFLVICTNTMHKMAPEIEESTSMPILHIADAAAGVIKNSGWKKVGLLGTKFTMEQDFYSGRLQKKHGIDVIIPDENERDIVHEVIYTQLVKGIIDEGSRKQYVDIIRKLASRGAEAVVLGCTEIPLLVRQEDSPVPLLDTTTIHAESAVEYALT